MTIINATTEKKKLVVERGKPVVATLLLLYTAGEVVAPPVRFELTQGKTPIGREIAEQHGICLSKDRRSSRLHATIYKGVLSESLRLVDNQSKNGSFVNGEAVSEAPLREGDIIGIGDSFLMLRFERIGEDNRDAPVPELLGVSPQARRLRRVLHEVAPTQATVLLLGESGCGKEVTARAIHRLSGRQGPLVSVNCSAVPESLAESSFFGQLAGAYTGAVARPGFFRAAEGGTLFLDEVGDLPQAVQPKLLRVLEDRQVLPVGAVKPAPCDVRIVAATNRDLEQAQKDRTFRADLYARLAEFPVYLPPLRERREDILSLLLLALSAPAQKLTPALVEALLVHRWPYNVREVFTLSRQFRILGADRQELDVDLWSERGAVPVPVVAAPSAGMVPPAGAEEPEVEVPIPSREELIRLIRAHDGVITEVARVVGRSRKQVYRWLKHHGIDLDSVRDA